MREKRLIFAVLALFLMAFVVTSTPVKAQDRTTVTMYVWNTATSSINYPWKAYGTTAIYQTYVQVWIDAPEAWTDTPAGIVGWKVTLKVNPDQVQCVNVLQYPDDQTFPDGFPDDFLGLYLGEYITEPYPGMGILWAPPLIDVAAGTMQAGEAIGGFTTLGKGSGGALTKIDGTPFALTPNGDKLIPLLRFQIRTKQGVVGGPGPGFGSWLELIDAVYTTVDGVNHPVDIVGLGSYGQPPDLPEFPFGIGILMVIAPAVAVMYLWRRKKVTKP